MYAVKPIVPERDAVLAEIVASGLPNIRLDIHGVHIHIHSNLSHITDAVRESYAFFEVETDPSDAPARWFHILALSSDGPDYPAFVTRLFPGGPYPPHCLLPIDYKRVYCIADQFVLHYYTGTFFTALMEAMLYDDHLIVHGAALVKDDVGIMLPGALRCGKTTLTLNFLYRGFRFATDDIILMNRESLKVFPYPRPLNVRRDSLGMVPGIHRDYDKMRYSAAFDEPRWFLNKTECVAEPFRCRYVVFPSIGNGAPRLVPISKTDAALELVKNSFYPITPIKRYGHTGENLPTIGRLLENAECFRLVQGDPRASFRLLLDALGT